MKEEICSWIEEIEYVFSLFPKKPNIRTVHEKPMEVNELLAKFEDIILDNLPNRLCLLRSINHSIYGSNSGRNFTKEGTT